MHLLRSLLKTFSTRLVLVQQFMSLLFNYAFVNRHVLYTVNGQHIRKICIDFQTRHSRQLASGDRFVYLVGEQNWK